MTVEDQALSNSAGEFSSVESNPGRGSLSPIFTPEVLYWEPKIVDWAEAYGVDPNMAAIIMQVESCGDPEAISIAGAQGLFQVMPFHFLAEENSLDPDTNAMRGLLYFADRLKQTNGDVGRAFAGYNGGHVAAASGWDSWAYETQRYYIWTTGLYTDIKSGTSESPTLERWLAAGGTGLCRQAANRLGL
jgi:soluble lytic murein transglycosylase-like protein